MPFMPKLNAGETTWITQDWDTGSSSPGSGGGLLDDRVHYTAAEIAILAPMLAKTLLHTPVRRNPA